MSEKCTKRRKDYFREYNRKNRLKLKMMVLLGGAEKIMESNKLLSNEIIDKTELMRKEQVKLEIKINQIKKFINIK